MVEPPSDQAVPRRAAGILACELPDALLLHVPGGSVALTLNDSAREVWELCDGERTVAAIARDLAARFDAGACDIPRDVGAVVLELVRLEVLALSSPPDPDLPGR
jgi:hypothetical protein